MKYEAGASGIIHPIVVGLPNRSLVFQARQEIHKELDLALKEKKIAVLVGELGIGKSAEAIHYAYYYIDHPGRYSFIGFIDNEDEASYSRIVTALKIKKDKFYEYLEDTHPGKWLLLLDNTKSHEDKSIPYRGSGEVIITSSNPNWPDAIKMRPFTRKESISLLAILLVNKNFNPYEPQHGEILSIETPKKLKALTFEAQKKLVAIAQGLGDYPQAMMDTADWINRKNMPWFDYLKDLNDIQTGKIKLEFIGKEWHRRFERTVIKLNHNSCAETILELLVWLKNTTIPRRILYDLCRAISNSNTAETMNGVMEELIENGVVCRIPTYGLPYRVPRYTQLLLHKYLEDHKYEGVLERGLDALNRIIKFNRIKDIEEWIAEEVGQITTDRFITSLRAREIASEYLVFYLQSAKNLIKRFISKHPPLDKKTNIDINNEELVIPDFSSLELSEDKSLQLATLLNTMGIIDNYMEHQSDAINSFLLAKAICDKFPLIESMSALQLSILPKLANGIARITTKRQPVLAKKALAFIDEAIGKKQENSDIDSENRIYRRLILRRLYSVNTPQKFPVEEAANLYKKAKEYMPYNKNLVQHAALALGIAEKRAEQQVRYPKLKALKINRVLKDLKKLKEIKSKDKTIQHQKEAKTQIDQLFLWVKNINIIEQPEIMKSLLEIKNLNTHENRKVLEINSKLYFLKESFKSDLEDRLKNYLDYPKRFVFKLFNALSDATSIKELKERIKLLDDSSQYEFRRKLNKINQMTASAAGEVQAIAQEVGRKINELYRIVLTEAEKNYFNSGNEPYYLAEEKFLEAYKSEPNNYEGLLSSINLGKVLLKRAAVYAAEGYPKTKRLKALNEAKEQYLSAKRSYRKNFNNEFCYKIAKIYHKLITINEKIYDLDKMGFLTQDKIMNYFRHIQLLLAGYSSDDYSYGDKTLKLYNKVAKRLKLAEHKVFFEINFSLPINYRFFEKKLAKVQSRLKENSGDYVLYRKKGDYDFELGLYNEAIRDYEAVLEEYTSDYVIMLQLGSVHHSLRDYAKAICCYEEVKNHQPDNQLANIRLKYSTQAFFYQLLRREFEIAPASKVAIFVDTVQQSFASGFKIYCDKYFGANFIPSKTSMTLNIIKSLGSLLPDQISFGPVTAHIPIAEPIKNISEQMIYRSEAKKSYKNYNITRAIEEKIIASKEFAQMVKDIAISFQSQIYSLNLKSVRRFAKYIVGCMLEYIGSTKPAPYLPWQEKLREGVRLAHSKASKKLKTDPVATRNASQTWNARELVKYAGIETEVGRFFVSSGKQKYVKRFGYRSGTEEEAVRNGYWFASRRLN